MKILLVCRLNGSGGIAVYIRAMAKGLSRQGQSVTILTTHSKGSEDGDNQPFSRYEYLTNPDLHFLRRIPLIGKYYRPIGQLFYSWRVWRFISKSRKNSTFDVIEFADVEAEGFVYSFFKRKEKMIVRCHTPTVLLEKHSLDSELNFDTSMTKWMEKKAIESADVITTPSLDMAKQIKLLFSVSRIPIYSVPNAVDMDLYPGGIQNKPSAKVIVLHIGRFERVKGIGVLAEAIRLINERSNNLEFVFIGGARNDVDSQRWTETLNKSGDNVQILGFLDESELLKWYTLSDIVVVPSLNYESFSYTCAQGMAMGKPVIASDIGGIAETIGDDAGILFPMGDGKALAEKILAVSIDSRAMQKMGKAGRAKVLREFDIPVVTSKMLKVYRSE